jgi:group I intron endonuclease
VEDIKEKTYFVYIHTNKINNKVYIGITGQALNDRWNNGYGYWSKQSVFYRAIKKYGWDGFNHEVVAKGLTEEEAKKLEIELIALYQSNCLRYKSPTRGYNMTDGGDGTNGCFPSDETRRKQSEAKKGKPSPKKGTKLTDQQKEKHINCYKDTQKEVIQIDLYGNYIACYRSIREASRMTCISKAHISKCCNHNPKYLSAGGYQWLFKNEYDENTKMIYVNPILKQIVQMDFDGNYITEYNSIIDAAKITGINPSDISACCRGVIKSAGNFLWLFKKDYDENVVKTYEEFNYNKPVVQLSLSGVYLREYDSIKEAAMTLNVDESSISSCCHYRQKSAYGFIWLFKKDYGPFNKIQYKRMGRHRKVVQLSLNNEYIAEFESIKDAAISISGNECYIGSCCKGNKKDYKDYKWMYKEDWDKLQLTIQN